jgi:peptide/nickel transport system permease protein
MLVSKQMANQSTEADIDKLRHEYGLDKPMIVQFFNWLAGVFEGDFGISISNGRDVLDDLVRRLPITLHLGILAHNQLAVACPGCHQCGETRHLDRFGGNPLSNICITIPVFGWQSY